MNTNKRQWIEIIANAYIGLKKTAIGFSLYQPSGEKYLTIYLLQT